MGNRRLQITSDLRLHHSVSLQCGSHFRDVRLQILEHHRFSVMQRYEAIMADISVADLMDFVNRFKAELHIEGLIQGNVTSTVSLIDDLCHLEQVFTL